MATNIDQPTRFDVILGQVKALDTEGGAPRIICTASSDEVDLGLDRFMLSALQQMAASFPGMVIFLNHKYSIPEDVFGVVTKATVIPRNGHNDLDLEIAVDSHSDRAMSVYHQIQSGFKLGVSVGVLVDDASLSDEKVDGKRVLNIKSVKTLEASIVGIPANRRSWVQGALKAASMYFDGEARSFLDELADTLNNAGGTVVADNEEDVLNTEVTPAMDEVVSEAAVAEVIETPAEASVTEPEASVTVVVVQVDDDDDEPDADDPMEMADPNMLADSPTYARGEAIAALRAKYTDKNREWFTIKAAAPAEPDATGADAAESVAEILIYDAIGDGLGSKDFVEQIGQIKASRINVRLNSPGGVIDDGIAIRNALARHDADVYTYVDGIAASMASVIALVGKEVTMEPDSMLMIHEPWGCQMGNTHDMAREARILDKYATNIAGAYARKAGGERDDWRVIMRDEGWYTAEEAVDAGLADRVGDTGNADMAQKSFDPRILALFKNTPESAKRFFTASIEPTTTASIEPTNLSSAEDMVELTKGVSTLTGALTRAQTENEELRAQIEVKDEEIRIRAKDLADANAVFNELVIQANKTLDSLMPRKTGDSIASGIETIAAKYKWLAPEVVAMLARPLPMES